MLGTILRHWRRRSRRATAPSEHMRALFVLACLIALNIWMTRRILRAGEHLEKKGLYITMVWIAPFIGAPMVHGQVRPHEQPEEPEAPAPNAPTEPPPHELSAPGAPPLVLASHMESANGFPLVDWAAVEDWLAAIEDPADRQRARLHSVRAWLLHMREVLGPHFSLQESDNAFVLSSLESAVATATANYVSKARKGVSRVLGKLAQFPPDQKSIVLVLDDEDWYYHYVGVYYPAEGEFAFSGGMFINAGCPHFVVRRADLTAIEPVIAHELTHSAVHHLQLPLWLDEGLAVNTEHKIAGATRGLHTPHQLHAQHRRFWGEAEIQQFWSGESFSRPDEGNSLSYDLARLMVEQMARTWAPFESFVLNAARADAGATAAQIHLGVDLGAYVCALFEKETSTAWSPRARPLELSVDDGPAQSLGPRGRPASS